MDLTPRQNHILEYPLEEKLFLRGLSGTGKTTAAIARLEQMITRGTPAESILVLVPQRPLGRPYTLLANRPGLPSGGRMPVLTVGGLARRMVELFWPLICDEAGFGNPETPQFLTVETTQYFLSLIVDPLREQGYFDGLAIEPLRLYSQILDNLNKTAVVGFPLEEIASRLRGAWNGAQADARFFDQAQECAIKFRRYCLDNSLLDFSLQLDVFTKYLWKKEIFRDYLRGQYHHLVYDNMEEDYPVAHDLIREWLPDFDSALLIMDESAGYRSFLGADPESASSLSLAADKSLRVTEPILIPETVKEFGRHLAENIRLDKPSDTPEPVHLDNIHMQYNRFFPQMLDKVTAQIETYIKAGARPGDIAVLSPFVSDSLRFTLQIRLEKMGIPLTTHRPGRELRNEPAVRCLFTMAKLAFPQWNLKVTPLEFRSSMMTAVDGLDMLRADLMANTLLSRKPEGEPLNTFSILKPEMADRITYVVGEKYETIRLWLLEARQPGMPDLPGFFSRCFGELLSQKGFGFHHSYDLADATERLIESTREFMQVIQPTLPDGSAGAEFLGLLEEGITGAQYLPSWMEERPDAVLLSPAFTFLMRNQAYPFQFWLDPGNTGWWERLNQPLTHPVVLSRNWPPGKKWTDTEELNHNQNTLIAHTGGLLNRCTQSLHLCLVQVDEQGNEPRGPLLQSVNRFLRYHPGGIELHDA
jgi:hypothetical protein